MSVDGAVAGARGDASRELFWPPADDLLEATERIRARLGEWPVSPPWRLCLTVPEQPGPRDLLVAGKGESESAGHEAAFAPCLDAGGGVLQYAAGCITLRFRARSYRLAGEPCDDWLPALAAFLDCGFEPHDALCLALAWRVGDEQRADAWPVEFARFPRVLGLPDAPPRAFAPCPRALGLYAVVPDAGWVERLCDAGVRTVQLRYKEGPPAVLAAHIRRAAQAAARAGGVRLFINDHWRLAIEAGAYGVHLGQEDLQSADLAALAAAGLRLGLSSHGYFEMLVALHFRPSYVALGAIFATTTKAVATAPQGTARLRRYVQLLDGVVPFVAIGGIDARTLPAVVAAGARSAAVVRAITAAEDPEAALAALAALFGGNDIS